MLFTIRINFWDISWTYLFLFNTQNSKSSCWIIFLKRFPIINFWWVIYSFPVIFIYKQLNIWNSFWMQFNFSIVQCNRYRILKTFIILFFFIYCWFFCNASVEMNQKIKSPPLIDVFKYLEQSESKSSLTTSFTSS